MDDPPEIQRRKSEGSNDHPWDTAAEAGDQSGTAADGVKSVIPTQIYGSEGLVVAIRTLCEKYKDIFASELRPEPAKVPPIKLKLKPDEKWDKRHCVGPRPQGVVKEKEIASQVNKMLNAELIEPSVATSYSQVLLANKPDGSYRFCVDYCELNLETESNYNYPIPNINAALHRIGDSRPRVFGICDLTKGFHQAPVDSMSRAFTAFVTFLGVFQWLRCPMGLKNAPAYFQWVMATVVLAGLISVICELYIDDCIIYGQTETEFLERLEKVFARFREHNITVNPDKCRLGLPNIEYVGHTIDEEGIHFSREKIQEVLDFPKPESMAQMKSFLGLTNYFRDHIRNMSTIAKPLHDMVRNYKKKAKLEWTEARSTAFTNLVKAVEECPKLRFLDTDQPVRLYTDASAYGIGGYLCQLDADGKEVPIAIFSKSLVDAQLNWHTYDQ